MLADRNNTPIIAPVPCSKASSTLDRDGARISSWCSNNVPTVTVPRVAMPHVTTVIVVVFNVVVIGLVMSGLQALKHRRSKGTSYIEPTGFKLETNVKCKMSL